MTLLVRFSFPALVCVRASSVQLAPFQASVVVPRPDTHATFPSSVDPSHLQTAIGFAVTIQFPAFRRGNIGFFPAVLAGPPKHIAVPIPSVSVGVTNIRKKLLAESAPSIPHAPRVVLQTPVYSNGEIGHITGAW